MKNIPGSEHRSVLLSLLLFLISGLPMTQAGEPTTSSTTTSSTSTSTSSSTTTSTTSSSSTTVQLDFGDVIFPGVTLLSDDGARHVIVSNFFMGLSVDAETNGLPSVNANGDDLDALPSDEDGWPVGNFHHPGNPSELSVTVSTSGYIQGWVDFNQDQVWSEGVERIYSDHLVFAGTTNLPFLVPAFAVPGTTFARFRFSSVTNLGVTGLAPDGEVEDHAVAVEEPLWDYGDAPEDFLNYFYPTILVNGGARHVIVEGVRLGASIDAEIDGQAVSLLADGDDNDFDGDDEDGIFFLTSLISGSNAQLSVTASVAGYLQMWVDYNMDGNWLHLNEWVLQDHLIPAGETFVDFLIPDDIDGLTFARFRFSTQSGLNITGDAVDGEVEDYAVIIVHTNTDFGDAPELDTFYQTRLANDAARHRIRAGMHLGSLVDADSDGLPTLLANGDDVLDGLDDEDGVTFLARLAPGLLSSVEITTSTAGTLNAWIDFDGDGTWFQSAEQIAFNLSVTGSVDVLNIAVPGNAMPGPTHARFRFSTQQHLNPFGLAIDGEVEDYLVQIVEYDFGDAPFPTVTSSGTNAAHHLVTAGIYLGGAVDGEPNGQVSATADGDDTDSDGDDEDGVVFLDALYPGAQVRVDVEASTSAVLQAWIDFDQDSQWEAGEQIFADQPVTVGISRVLFSVPEWTLPGLSFGRFRFSTATNLGVTGFAPDGEVEDYPIPIETPDWDMGDAPDGFPTTLAQDGARHVIVSHVMLGAAIDAELDGQPTSTASGDDVQGVADEDGIAFLTPLLVGSGAVMQVSASTSGYVQVWIDYDRDGDWEPHEEEQVFSNRFIHAGMTNLSFLVPFTALSGEAIARVRFSTRPHLGLTGFAPDGEVEDSLVNIGAVALDYGDAPTVYPTAIVANGARHAIVQGVHMGSTVDGDPDGQPSPSADADDLDGGGDDEDGVVFLSAWVPGAPASIRVDVSLDGFLQCWVDFEGNSSWTNAGNQVFDNLYLTTGQHVLAIPVPGGAALGPQYMRFRFSTVADITFNGFAEDGEVEDYRVLVSAAPEAPVLTHCPVWLQGADILHGIDVESWMIQLTEERREVRVADDWLSDGRWVTGLRWWGSYLGWRGAPEDVPQNVRPQGFRLTLYANLSTNVSGEAFPLPGGELAHEVVSYSEISESLYSISDLSFVSSNEFEYEFIYQADLDTPWSVNDGETYWLGVEAIYPAFFFSYRWGWCTTPLSEGYGEKATLRKRADLAWSAMTYTPDVVSWRDVTNHPAQGEAIDQAFEVLTSECPEREVQSAQSSDDAASHALASSHDLQQNIVRADDFEGDGRRILELDWQGSYPGWRTGDSGSATNPIAPPDGPDGLAGFMLTLMAQDGASCLPGLVRTSLFVRVEDCNENYGASVLQAWRGGTPWMQQYAYRVDLSDPWQTDSGSNTWLSIQAIFDSGSLSTNHQGWAWQLAANTQHCGSARSVNGGIDWGGATLSAPHPRQGQTFDLVFSILTDEVTPGPPAAEPEVIGIWSLDTDVIIESLGDGGLGSHVLQYSSNLVDAVWLDLVEDPLPLAAPLTNFWYFPVPPGSNLFFRIEQR